jgi:ABC-type antimicrobial peptide transport system permease subunit
MSKDFLKLVIISFAIASPVAWFAMEKWLDDYTYRISMQWWIFVAAGLLSVVIALITIIFHVLKAAIANPVKSLRTE